VLATIRPLNPSVTVLRETREPARGDTGHVPRPGRKPGDLCSAGGMTMFLAPETRNRDLTASDHKPQLAGIGSRSDASKSVLA
jgi:hypothetical protein